MSLFVAFVRWVRLRQLLFRRDRRAILRDLVGLILLILFLYGGVDILFYAKSAWHQFLIMWW